MKNKWYILLIIVYILTFGFILDINGVFGEEVILTANLIINVSFLAIIGVLFLFSIFSFIRLNSLTGAMVRAADEMERQFEPERKNLWPDYRKKTDPFSSSVLNRRFARYQKHVSIHTDKKGNVSHTCPIEEYINEDLVNQVGRTWFNSNISGAMTGLGILGTFLGLSLGLSSFSGNDIFTISENVAPLLDGMKVAFHTSVYGIFFSLIFSFVYRSLMADAYEKLDQFLTAFHEYAQPGIRTKEDALGSMMLYQAGMSASLRKIQELLQGNAREQIEGVDKIVRHFMTGMSEIMGEEFGKLGRSMERSCEVQSACGEDLRQMTERMQRMLESCNTIHDVLDHALDRQKRLEETLSDTCEQIGNELYTLSRMRDRYEE